MRTQGIVEYVDHTSTGGIKIKVNGTSYSAFDSSKVKVNQGDYVEFDYTEKPGVNNRTGAPVVYRNIKGTVIGVPQGGAVTGRGPAMATTRGTSVGAYAAPEAKPGAPILDTQRLILRQNALTAAVKYVSEVMTSGDAEIIVNNPSKAAKVVINIAKEFEEYTSGDGDLKEVQNSLDNDDSE